LRSSVLGSQPVNGALVYTAAGDPEIEAKKVFKIFTVGYLQEHVF